MSDNDKLNQISDGAQFKTIVLKPGTDESAPWLRSLLGLKPVKEEELTFGQFLDRLKTQPYIAETAASLLVRAIETSGEVDIDQVPAARRPYLRRLKQQGIIAYKAFDHVRGSQRIVHKLINHLRAAAANGYQVFQAVALRGGPGSGKGLLGNACKDVLESQIVYVLPTCPVHENPLNLLTLLPLAVQQKIGEGLGVPGLLEKLLAVAGKPCQDCWKAIMEGKDANNPPNLFDVPVHAVRISSRKFGIATWSPSGKGQGCSLYSALLRGSRGIVDMPELFTVTEPAKGEASELDILIEATNDRAIPLAGSCGTEDAQGRAPIDAVLLGQTNLGSMAEFLKKAMDPNRYQRRFNVLDVPYITSVTEEEFAYRDHLAKMKALPHIDPMALKMAALLAVISRLKKDHEVDVVTRARMYDGEDLLVEKKSSSTRSSSGSSGYWSTSTSSSTKTEKEFWTVQQFWAEAGEDEGMFGVNIPDMLAIVSQAVDFYMKRKPQFLSSLRMIRFLKARIDEMNRRPNLTDKDKEVLKNCMEFLKFARFKGDDPGLIEREYRRVLKRELLAVFAPDYESRAEEIYQRYQLHARFAAQGLTEFPDPKNRSRKIQVDTDFLNKVDEAMGLDSWGDDRIQFRRAFDAEILAKTQEHSKKRESGDPSAQDEATLTINWKTLPKLEAGIRKMLNDDVEKQIERILSPAVFQLNEQEQKHREESLERFRALGYTEDSLEEALQYVKDFELWK